MLTLSLAGMDLSTPVVFSDHFNRLGSYGGEDSPLDISRVRRYRYAAGHDSPLTCGTAGNVRW